MSIDIDAWRDIVVQVVSGIADEDLQRRAWFGIGPEQSSPDEDFSQFFGDAAIEDFLKRTDNGLNDLQSEAGRHLVTLMRDLSRQTTEHIEPANLIDDPRWKNIREAAARFSALLAAGGATGGTSR
jgi:hypothetical protein